MKRSTNLNKKRKQKFILDCTFKSVIKGTKTAGTPEPSVMIEAMI